MTETFRPSPLDDQDELQPAAGTALRELATEDDTTERRLSGGNTRVTLDGQEPFTVRVDNRDYVRWDMTAPRQKWVTKDGPMPVFLMATFTAWSAATRAGLTTLDWKGFQAACVGVASLSQEDEDDARPTQ